MPVLHHEHKPGMGAFKRGLTTSPFQIPLLAYLFIQGFVIIPHIHEAAVMLDVPDWTVWNFVALLIGGAGLATFSRFNANERLEAFGLHLLMLSLIVVVIIQIAGHSYELGDEVAIFAGCWLRAHVLRKSRKAQKLAIKIVTDNDEEKS